MIKALTFITSVILVLSVTAQDNLLLVYNSDKKGNATKIINADETSLKITSSLNPSQYWQIPSAQMFSTTAESRFSELQASANFMNTENYPASAVVKIVAIHKDTTWDKCSGMMVGDRYVLTAGHCVINDVDGWQDLREFVPNLFVRPGFDNGRESKHGKIKVQKIYIYKSYFNGCSKRDIALLELAEPIGHSTGWVNMDYEEDDKKMNATRFYNFSYPMDGVKVNYYRDFNGDTMYLKSGFPDLVSQNYIGIKNIGIPGESGSLLITENNNNGYKTIGVRNFSEMDFSFYRLKKQEVFAFYNIMNNTDTPVIPLPNLLTHSSIKGISIWPNPVFEKAIITASPSIDKIEVTFMGASGAEVYKTIIAGNDGKFILENYNLPQGSYLLIAEQNKILVGTTKVIIRK